MSLLPIMIAVVVVAYVLLFRLLGERTQKSQESQLPPAPQTPPPSDTDPLQEKQGQEPTPPGHLASPPDGLASFHFESKSYPKPATISPPRRHPCRVCGVPSTKRCLRCRSAYYCSREHSLQDWRTHKPHCLPTVSRSRSPSRSRPGPLPDAEERVRGLRPGDTITVAAYFFGVDADAPRIVRVTCTLKEPEEEGYMWHSPNFKEYAQWPALGYVGLRRTTPAPTAPLLDHPLSLFFHEFGLFDEQRPNRCVEKLVGGPGKTYQQWVGDIMLFRDEIPDRYRDVTEDDLGPAIEYFRDYGRP